MTREDAKKYIYECLDYTEATEVIKALELEPCEDCVSRQAVLAIAGDSCLDLDSYEDTKEFCDTINELPSVTPTKCIATVSFNKKDMRELIDEKMKEIVVERKKGKWIDTDVTLLNRQGYIVHEVICSECNGISYFRKMGNKYIGANLCPNCGCKMSEG